MFSPSRPVFVPSDYTVRPVKEADAKAFILAHHYSHSYPSARFRVGLFRASDDNLVGVAVFSVPMHQAVIPRWTGLPTEKGVELGRLVVLDEVGFNAETWFLARAFRLLADALPEVEAVMSCADPEPRYALDGSCILVGHVGTIYKALNGRYVGRTGSRWILLAASGEIVPPRAISGSLKGDIKKYAEPLLVRLGAPPREEAEGWTDYIRRVRASGAFRKVKHPGNHVYVWPTKNATKATIKGLPPALPYPLPNSAPRKL
jgi:hypothetical protein